MIRHFFSYGLICSLCITFTACAPSGNFAPVVDVKGYEAVPTSGDYRVTSRDTLYSVAWRYGVDYRELAKNNHIDAPYAIYAGQVIQLREPVQASPREPVVTSEPSASLKPIKVMPRLPEEKPIIALPSKDAEKLPAVSVTAQKKISSIKKAPAEGKEPNFKITSWLWPAHGKLLTLYSSRNKGIDIGGAIGAPVYAAAPGKVVYAGSGLRGYGNLIIIKHNSQYPSAYAFNKRLFVHEGDWVKKKQVIAAMGHAPGGQASLHFEIRRAGLPVNPLNLLHQ